MSDRLIGFLLLLLSVVLYVQTFYFRRPAFSAFESMGSEFVPRGILIGLGIFSLILLVAGKGSLVPTWRKDSVRSLFTRYREVLLCLALFPLYALFIDLIGFAYSTVIYLFTMQLVLKRRRAMGIVYTLAGSAAFTWAITTVFEKYLNVVLPSGSIF